MHSDNDYEMDLEQLFKGNDVIRVENEGEVQSKVKRGDLQI